MKNIFRIAIIGMLSAIAFCTYFQEVRVKLIDGSGNPYVASSGSSSDTFFVSFGTVNGLSGILVDGDTLKIDTTYVKNLDSLGVYFDSLTVNSLFTNYFDSLEINTKLGAKLDTTTFNTAIGAKLDTTDFNTKIGAYFDTTISKALFTDSTEIKKYWDSLTVIANIPNDSILYIRSDSFSTGYKKGTYTVYFDTTASTGGTPDTFQIVRSDSFNTTGWIHNGDAIYVDTTGGTSTPSDSIVWNTLVGRRTGNQEIKIFGTANLANRLDGSLFKCKRGSSSTVGYIDSCIYASDSITVTVVTTETLLVADSTIAPMRYTPNFKTDNFLRTISLYGEIIADTLYPQGMWYWMQDACYLLPIDAYLVTAAATNPALTFKFYSDATALNSTAFDMVGNTSLLRQRMTTKSIARGTRLSMRIWSVAGTTKPADMQVIMYVVPQKIYLGE